MKTDRSSPRKLFRWDICRLLYPTPVQPAGEYTYACVANLLCIETNPQSTFQLSVILQVQVRLYDLWLDGWWAPGSPTTITCLEFEGVRSHRVRIPQSYIDEVRAYHDGK